MPKLDLDELEAVRRSICSNCEHYNRKKDACQFIVLKTGKLGLLSHENGVRNPKARCPYFLERKWNLIPSFYAWELNRIVMPLSMKEVHEYTICHYLSVFAIIERARSKGSELKNSEIMARVRTIAKQPNQYQHLPYLNVDYVTGEVSE